MYSQTTLFIVFGGLIFFAPYMLRNKFGRTHLAGLMVTVGILGTFVGVFWGLFNFDTQDITNSVPTLLDGLKTAFITSIAGLSANIVLRVKPSFYGYSIEDETQRSNDIGEQLVVSMNRVADSISGDEDGSLLTQLQKIRTTNIDGFKDMRTSFDTFAEKVVADNTQSLIDALTQVMKDFNTQINEQFGENFKQLNEGVGAMLEWQQEYKKQVEELTEKFQAVSGNIEDVRDNLESISDRNKSIQETNDAFNKTVSDFAASVGSFTQAGEKAKESFPIIERNMDNLTAASNEFIRKSVVELEENYKNFKTTQEDLMRNSKNEIAKMVEQNKERIKKLDEELGNELNKSLQSLGSHLTSLSEHFVNDYRPLTEQLKRVVEISKNLD